MGRLRTITCTMLFCLELSRLDMGKCLSSVCLFWFRNLILFLWLGWGGRVSMIKHPKLMNISRERKIAKSARFRSPSRLPLHLVT